MSTTTAMRYVNESLGASGFAVINTQIAMTTRPDLWHDGMECAKDLFSSPVMVQVGGLLGIQRYRVRLKGLDDLHLVLSRSADLLERRVEWVSGYAVEEIFSEGDRSGQILAAVPAPKQTGVQAWREFSSAKKGASHVG